MHPTRRRPDRLRRRAARALPWSLALLAPLAQAAAFLPGPEADPPTGDAAPRAAREEARAAEPLQAEGFEFRFGPWRRAGSLTLDARWLRTGDGATIVQGVTHTQFDVGSYLWQPWFAQVRLGLGVLTSNDRQSGGFGDSTAHGSVSLTGRAALALFPASRFPFEVSAEFSDTRAGGETLSGDVETRRFSLTQSYTPQAGMDRFQLQIDHSRLESNLSGDTLTTFMASAQGSRGPHSYEVAANHSLNRSDGSDERTRLTTLVARHGFQPTATLQLDTMATLTDFRTDDLGDSDIDLGTQVRQISSLASWRPQPGEPLYWEDRPVQLAGSVRWTDARAVGDLAGASAQTLSATGGGTIELSREWRLGGAVTGTRSESVSEVNHLVGGNANLTWTPPARGVGDWSWGPTAGVSAGATHSNTEGRRWIAGVQAGHTLSRQWRLSDSQALSLNLAQNLGVLHESREDEATRTLSHGVGLYWQQVSEDGSQRYASFSFTDARTYAELPGSYQFANISLNQRTALSRYSYWSANLTAQASRNDATEIDAFTGATLTTGNGWQYFYSGGASLEQQRFLGVPRLRHTLQLTLNSQQIERREFGDINATRQRVSAALESRIEYAIGRLSLRLIARVARIEDQTQAFLMARAQRSF